MLHYRLFFLIIGLLFTCQLVAQDRYKPSSIEIASLPLWAQEMYGTNPNVFQVEQLYKDYYQNNPFEKNYHTQYYKKWRKQMNGVDNDGFEIILPLREKMDRLALTQQNNNRSGNWTVLGPFVSRTTSGDTVAEQSNIYCVDKGTSNPAVWYCGTETGEVYRSANSGLNWSNISLNQLFDGGVTAIEIDPTNEDVVYVGSGDFIFKTIDGGQNWVVSLAVSGLQVNEILTMPVNSDTVFVAANRGLYRSTDAGLNWTTVYNTRCYDIKNNTANSNTIYIVKRNPTQSLCEFFISTDAGQTFTQQTTGWHTSTDPGRNDGGARLAVSPANPNRVYAYLIGESKTGDTGYIGVYRSDDGGLTWTLPNGPAGGPYTTTHTNLAIGNPGWQYHQGFYNCALIANPANADHILLGSLNLYKSEDGGATFFPLAGYVGGSYPMHVDMQDFRVVGNSTIITTDGGIYHSNDFFETQNFEVRMNGIHASDFWGFGQGWNEDVFVGGLYHNGNLAYHENYGSGNFLQLGGGEPASGYVNPGENRKVYSSDINGRILPLTIGDPSPSIGFGIDPNESYWEAESTELEFLPNCHNIAFTGYQNDLWKTTDGCNSFSLFKEFGTNDDDRITYIEISRSNPNVMYVCQQQASPSLAKLWKTIDGGQTWTTVFLPSISGNSRRLLIQLDPTNENHLYIAFTYGNNGTKVYRTTDGGLIWTNLTTADINGENIHSLVLIPNTGGDLYAFTSKRVWYRNNSSSNWTNFSTGLPIEINSNIARPFYRDGKLRLASYGRGIWEASLLNEPSAPVAQIGVDQLNITQHCDVDSFYFVDQSIVNHQGATWQWEFFGGSPATATGIYAAVAYNTPGTYLVRLTVTDGLGNASIDSLYLTVNGFQAQIFVSEDFEGAFLPAQFEIYNPDDAATWEQTTTAGGYGLSSKAAWMNNYDYWQGGDEDDLRVSLDFNSPSDNWLYFDVAYARYAVNYSDSLEVLISTDCGQTMNSVYFKGGSDLATSPDNSSVFVPLPTEWRTDSVDLSSYVGNNEIMVIFRNHSGWGNNIFVDNINLSQPILNIPKTTTATVEDFYLYPNPVASEGTVYCSTTEKAHFILYDLAGKKVFEDNQVMGAIQLPCLISGAYVYILRDDKNWRKGKLMVQ